MQGLLYHYLQDFVQSEFGVPFWEGIRERAGVPERSFLLMRAYPDHYVPDLVSAASEELAARSPGEREILHLFGRHLAGCFQRDFDFYFERFASARDMIAGIEPVIHTELRRHDPVAAPPRLRTLPADGSAMRLVYDSPRRLCDVARGLVEGVAEAFGEQVTILEPRCMRRGDASCEFLLSFS